MTRAGSSGAPARPPERTAGDRLAFLALATVHEAIEMARLGKVPPSPGLRLALALLYAEGKRRKPGLPRRSYDDFWRLATREDATGSGAEGYGRHINMTACFNGFAYTLGHEMTLELAVALQKASGPPRE